MRQRRRVTSQRIVVSQSSDLRIVLAEDFNVCPVYEFSPVDGFPVLLSDTVFLDTDCAQLQQLCLVFFVRRIKLHYRRVHTRFVALFALLYLLASGYRDIVTKETGKFRRMRDFGFLC